MYPVAVAVFFSRLIIDSLTAHLLQATGALRSHTELFAGRRRLKEKMKEKMKSSPKAHRGATRAS